MFGTCTAPWLGRIGPLTSPQHRNHQTAWSSYTTRFQPLQFIETYITGTQPAQASLPSVPLFLDEQEAALSSTMLLRPTLLRASPNTSSKFLPFTRPLLVAFGLSIPFFSQPRTTHRFDTSPSYSTSPPAYTPHAKTPLTKDGSTLNPAAVKQISLGSILGLGCGVLLSAFSRSLTLLLGVGIVVWQVSTAREGRAERGIVLTVCRSMLRGRGITSFRWTGCRIT